MFIKDVIKEFVDNDEQFTSVDVNNRLRSNGIYIRHHEIASWCRVNVELIDPDYEKVLIAVSGQRQAYLYKLKTDEINYDQTNQTLIPVKSTTVLDVNAPQLVKPPVVSKDGKKWNNSWANCFHQKRDSRGRFICGAVR